MSVARQPSTATPSAMLPELLWKIELSASSGSRTW
jgi:hypothetical protein